MNSRLLKRFYAVAGLAVAGALTLLVWQRPAVGEDDRYEGGRRRLAGTWNVTLQFPDTGACSGPGGPTVLIPALQTYLREGSILEVPGGTLFRGPGVGSWEHAEHLGDHQFVARFKFFLFNPPPSQPGDPPEGSRRGSEEVTSHIDLTGPNMFEAKATFDVFDAMGNPTAAQGCHINETATRFAEPAEGDDKDKD